MMIGSVLNIFKSRYFTFVVVFIVASRDAFLACDPDREAYPQRLRCSRGEPGMEAWHSKALTSVSCND